MTVSERIGDWCFDAITSPLKLTERPHRRVVRVLGLVLYAVAFLPLTIIFFPPMFVCMITQMFEETWRGE